MPGAASRDPFMKALAMSRNTILLTGIIFAVFARAPDVPPPHAAPSGESMHNHAKEKTVDDKIGETIVDAKQDETTSENTSDGKPINPQKDITDKEAHLVNLFGYVPYPAVVLDLVKPLQDALHFQFHPFSLVTAPETFLPNSTVLASMSPATIQHRLHFWASLEFFTYCMICATGTFIMFIPTIKKKMRSQGQDYNRLEHKAVGVIGVDRMRKLTMAIFMCNFCVDVFVTTHSVWDHQLSPKNGLDWEVYYVLLLINGGWMLLQAVWSTYRLPVGKTFPLTAFCVACVSGVFPVLSDAYDTLKDVMFGGICLSTDHYLLRMVGVLSWVYLFAIHVNMIFFDHEEILNELAGSYLPVILVDSAAETGEKLTFVQDTLLPLIYKQTTPSKRRLLISENCMQAGGAVVYSVVMHLFSPVVVLLNLGVPVAQYIFAMVMYAPLRQRVGPWVVTKYNKALEDGNKTKEEAFWHTIQSMLNEGVFPGLGNIKLQKLDLASRSLGPIDYLAEGLEKNKVLMLLDLSNNQIQNIDSLARVLADNKFLRMLYLSSNRIERINALAELLQKNNELKKIFLDDNKIAEIKDVAAPLGTNTALQELNLQKNKIQDIGALARPLANNGTLQVLNLRYNKIEDIRALAEPMASKTAKWVLDIRGNKVQPSNFDAFQPDALEKIIGVHRATEDESKWRF